MKPSAPTPCFLSKEQIRQIEEEALERGLDLMDLATNAIVKWYLEHKTQYKRALILIGPGNNGGDGVLSAIKLLSLGFNVVVIPICSKQSTNTEVLLTRYQAAAGQLLKNLPKNLKATDLIIDAGFGIAIKNGFTTKIKQLINKVNGSCVDVLAIDTPTGLNPFNGSTNEAVIKAKATITFISDKPGFYSGEGVDLVGEILVAPLIKLPDYSLTTNAAIVVNTIATIDYSILKRVRKNSHKGSFGKIVIIGGHHGMHGALYLAGRSALLTGCGKIILASLDRKFTTDLCYPELMTAYYEDVIENLNEFDAIVVGPGFGRDDDSVKALKMVLGKATTGKFIFDADALTIIAATPAIKKQFKKLANKIITPHVKEASQLLGEDVITINQDRFHAVLRLSQEFAAIALLKGYGSLINGGNTTYLNQTGNPVLAVAGQGDSLCGIIASMIAQGLDLQSALRFAVYIHGNAADLKAKTCGYNGIRPEEISYACREFLNTLLYPPT